MTRLFVICFFFLLISPVSAGDRVYSDSDLKGFSSDVYKDRESGATTRRDIDYRQIEDLSQEIINVISSDMPKNRKCDRLKEIVRSLDLYQDSMSPEDKSSLGKIHINVNRLCGS